MPHNPHLKIGVIGCGAVAEIGHLPALRQLGVVPHLLVDANPERLRGLQERFGAAHTASGWEAAGHELDAAIICLPHALHAPAALALLAAGVHLLVEKPLASTVQDAEAMAEAAKAKRAILAVGLLRRFRHVARWTHGLLSAGALGDIHWIEFQEGLDGRWPLASAASLRRETAGGGVLLDSGAHLLDLLTWWLGDAAELEYFDDRAGGVEADAEVRLRMRCGAQGRIVLSRTRDLRQTAVIVGSRGIVEVGLHENFLRARPRKLLRFFDGAYSGWRIPGQFFTDLFVEQLADFLTAISAGTAPRVGAETALPSQRLMEQCYQRRRPLQFPWGREHPGQQLMRRAES
ncbi:MAG: Gfo/Idh/MocA family oxidoreductase [Candidatus Schekmanbacteria bacterium]|nr:Gfo/Idh/MocA family oxidoreductase [Candidatus Schekmanbacteria bacterium]